MNLQLFGYDDGFYYGQSKLICEVETLDGNGKTVTVTDGTNEYSATVVDKIATFLLPPRSLYTVSLINGVKNEFTKKVPLGYGECVHVMMAEGYDPIIQKSKKSLSEILAMSTGLEDFVPDAAAVKSIHNDSLSSCKLITEGSGANIKYYIQKGADSASKKLLGSNFTAVFTVYGQIYEYYHSRVWGDSEAPKGELPATLTIKAVDGVVTSTITNAAKGGTTFTLEYDPNYDNAGARFQITRVELVSIVFGE